MALPISPPAPILLLVGGVFTILATLVLLSSFLSPHENRCTRLKLWHRYPPLQKSDGESATDLIASGPTPQPHQQRVSPPLAFLCLGIPALALATAAAGVELREVRIAKTSWDATVAREVGLTFEFGALGYREWEGTCGR